MDRELVTRAQRGDEAAFEVMALASHARLHRVARGILRDDDQADDAVQRALVQMWCKLRQLRDPDHLEGWSYRLVVNECYDEAKRARRWPHHLPIGRADEPAGCDEFRLIEDIDELERGFRCLSLEHRAVIVLRYLLGLSTEQVAEALDIPSGTVASRLHRAMTELRAAIEADARSSVVAHSPAGVQR
jgi:RNA polymerase sigma-70 factor (ECF subfamily)